MQNTFLTNAERIELFFNERESEQPPDRPDLFYTSEALKQVTFSAGQTRQVNGEYAHFISYRRVEEAAVDAVIVTACYADPLQLEKFFVKAGPSRPIIVFSHQLRLRKAAPAAAAKAPAAEAPAAEAPAAEAPAAEAPAAEAPAAEAPASSAPAAAP